MGMGMIDSNFSVTVPRLEVLVRVEDVEMVKE